ncbi:hypothetical protein K505DRAFT_297239 [Melanomma pulvis-pyrius CBS 109.77]|uniref:Nephrocystin 3-like N-terminal domain-containing protein n=1 Tax=Melanomma pulvis-pyrius CBS 109.77 TaxID=1314802 RepID=A0A6A6XP77_9PLEO|nr:hypothetical protein K505DRAFT_297239 [Melanomma pulvis-pyrius CBS 109.77]
MQVEFINLDNMGKAELQGNDHHAQDSHPPDDVDPFFRSTTTHPSLKKSHDLSSDIYHSLFNGFFKSDEFTSWIHRKTCPQLHCIGGPGSGKTTLTTLTAERIRHTCSQSLTGTAFIATIYISEDITEDEQEFFEDFLHMVYQQLTPNESLIGQHIVKWYNNYVKAQHAGKCTSKRVELIAKVLHARISEIGDCGRSFLLVDSIDQCSPTLKELLERELSALHKKGLSIMVTSRLPIYQKQRDVYCDFHEADYDYEDGLRFYLRCMSCEDIVICFSCKDKGNFCPKCGLDTQWEESKYLIISVDRIPRSELQNFVAWDLEREHGNIGLGTSDPCKLPPLSSMGISFLKAESGTAAREWVTRIVSEAHGSIALAKLGLDVVHGATSVGSIEWIPNRLPRNVQALFNDGIKSIEQQPEKHRNLALKSIAAVAKSEPRFSGASLSELANLLQDRPHASGYNRLPPRSAEHILQASKGYLHLLPPRFGSEEYTISAYNFLFCSYAAEGYNDELIWANAQLRTSNIPRSFTIISTKTKDSQPVKPMEDILGDLRKFYTESPRSMYSPKSPLPGRESPLTRSSTGYFRIQEQVPKPVGLGLGS